MLRRATAIVLCTVLLLGVMPLAAAENTVDWAALVRDNITESGEFKEPITMYIYTDNGKPVNVRSEPRINENNWLGNIDFGAAVKVKGLVVVNNDWAVIEYKNGPDGVAYVMSRFLTLTQPQRNVKQEEQLNNLAELNRQLASARTVEKPFMIAVRATRTSGWINFRVGPGVAADRIASLPDGRELKVIGETDKWYQAIDSETGKTGYISKNYVTVLAKPVEPETTGKESLGKLTVNGDFTLQCRLPEGYKLQVINMQGTKIVASILSEDKEKPMLYLSIAYDDLYANINRMNDMDAEDLAAVEASFTRMNEVNITYTETAHGTKLMVARETGSDTDFVDIFTVYRGYNIEFIMTPNPEASTQALSDEQVKMCVDFLSDLDFVRNGLVQISQ